MRRIAQAVGIAAMLIGCPSAQAHSPKVWQEGTKNGVVIGIHAKCGAAIRTTLRDGKHRASIEVHGGNGYQIGPSLFGPLIELEGGSCSQRLEETGPEEVVEPAQLKVTGLNIEPKETVAFRIFINGAPVEAGRVVLVREGVPPTRIWEGEDAFVNYCIDEGKRITSINGRLGCYRPGTYQDHGKVVWNRQRRR